MEMEKLNGKNFLIKKEKNLKKKKILFIDFIFILNLIENEFIS